jgi:hypothetical protein
LPEPTKIHFLGSNNQPDNISIPTSFKTLLESKRVVSITLGFKSSEVGLVTLEGNFLNPCQGVASNCKFDGNLEEAHKFIATHSGRQMDGYACPDRCLSSGISRGCKSPNTYFYCNNPSGSCGNTCN